MGLEFEVRVVGGIENCFVSVPLPLIQMLQQSTSSGLLTLKLGSLSTDSWVVAWSGASSSSSSAIEVSQQFAECISLPNRIKVQVRVASNMPKAAFVTIEPLSEDYREVLELNSEHAEAAILKQVVWQPYIDAQTYHPFPDIAFFTSCISDMDISEPYSPERVIQQFGRVQIVPPLPLLPIEG